MWYGVVIGRHVGAYKSWNLCYEAVENHPGATYRKFETLQQVTTYLNEHGLKHGDIRVHYTDGILTLGQYCERESEELADEVPFKPQQTFNLSWKTTIDIEDYSLKFYQRDFTTGQRIGIGLTLKPQDFLQLKEFYTEIQETLQNVIDGELVSFFESLSTEGVHVSVKSPFKVINIRHWYQRRNGALRPSQRGVTLQIREFKHLMNVSDLIERSIYTVPQQEETEIENPCIVCLQNPRDVILIACGHFCVCKNCAGQVDHCPLCRCEISQRINVFS